jgi:hypothetical protein
VDKTFNNQTWFKVCLFHSHHDGLPHACGHRSLCFKRLGMLLLTSSQRGQVREQFLKQEPMESRPQVYAAIKKLLATLNDPFTRFLDPNQYTTVRSGAQGACQARGVGAVHAGGSCQAAGHRLHRAGIRLALAPSGGEVLMR